jgi:hypothetical protein
MIIGLLVILGMVSSFSIIDHEKTIHESENVLHQNAESIVSLEDVTTGSSGTGFLANTKSGKQVIITNAHVCEINNLLPLFIVSHRENNILRKYSRFKVKPLKLDSEHDLCLVEVPKDFHFKSIKLAEDVYIDSKVTIVGYPIVPLLSSSSGHYRGRFLISNQYPLEDLKFCVAKKYKIETVSIKLKDGTIKNEQICVLTAPFMFTDALADKGQSGSPALNEDGEVVGVMSLVEGQLRAFAMLVPLSALEAFLSKH